jgi:flavin reductase (DIM6/NTAB) family NADH-FMN oxidoreductase RutF
MKNPIQSSIRLDGEVAPSGVGIDLKQAMAHWPSGVAVVAVRSAGRLEAVTIGSMISVSLDPAFVLFSLSSNAPIRPALDGADQFTISMLAADQARVAAMVADRAPNAHTVFSAEIVMDSVANMTCTVDRTLAVADHVLYVARVQSVRLGRDAPALIYVGRKYTSTL